MLEQKVANSGEIFKGYVNHCLEICRFTLDFQVGAKVCFIDHELVFWCCHYCRRILSFTNIILGYLQKFLLLHGCYLRAHHHITNISQSHESLLHREVSNYLLKGCSRKHDDVPQIGLFLLLLVHFLISLNHFHSVFRS